MHKFTTLIQTAWQRALTHRFSIIAYRIGEIIEVIFLIIMWSSLYEHTAVISGYTLPEMLTYILVGNLITFVTRNFLSDFMAREIKDGTLSLFLVKPISYFTYACIREFGRITMPFLLSLGTHLLIILFFWHRLIITTQVSRLLLLLLMVAGAFITELLISYIVGLIAFWTDEVDGVYTTINRLKKFVSGGYFPLSLLPSLYIKISYTLPFAYSFFVPTQLYLGKISNTTALKGIGVQIIWIGLLCGIIKLVWRRGVRRYEGVGI